MALAAIFICISIIALVAFGRLTKEMDKTGRQLTLDSGPQSTLVFDRHEQLVFSYATEQRTDRILEDLATPLVPAVLAIEDWRFYRHHGVDSQRMLGSFVVNLKAGEVVQGGSTITQQLVRLIALNRDRSFARKIREVLLALRIEQRFAKREILQAYLNRVYLGNGYYGVEAAARGYFDKSASDLNAAEAATLAALIKCPSACSPRVAPQRAYARRNVVLHAMLEHHWLTQEAYAAAVESPLELADRNHGEFTAGHTTDTPGRMCGLFFMDAVRRQLIERFGKERVYRDGLRVFTTIDPGTQAAAEEAVARRIGELETARRGVPAASSLEGSLVALDARTGEILALVGGRDFHKSPFNRAIDAYRQPGSAFKPILFAAALEQGITPASMMSDLDAPPEVGSEVWMPKDGHDASSYTLRQAMTVSSNRAAALLIQVISPVRTIDYARRLGISSVLPAVPSLALGTGEVTLLQLTAAYRTFANDGNWSPPVLIRRVENRFGEVLWEDKPAPYRALRSATAYLMTNMLADVVDRGTGSAVRAHGFRLPAAGKTGTTDDYADAWFVGYTPGLVAGVWFGFDQPAPIMARGFAATVAVPAWARFMGQATRGQQAQMFEVPPDIEHVALCRTSRLRATAACDGGSASPSTFVISSDGTSVPVAARHPQPGGVYDEVFMMGTAPEESCAIHGGPPDGDRPQPAAPPVYSVQFTSR